ncbi:antitoxin HipB [Fusicatenibacter saccharivorans]|uniref:Antitoxin HipB n=1 Tax=Fusicatenibacter saccharivorans TaxID=1150298 RepID=A0A174DE52_9FIRM|nr:helix-turn-helix transcriptional regulator [Fusicatenibacter saccharivorans]CUO23942.1 antitoxin HipB [Fusicatenibacter saccharivorans]
MNNPKMQVFATRLREIRNDNHMTQKEFAQKIGVTPAALSAYENNQKNPSVAVLQRIGENFDVSLTWLCGVAQRKSVNKVFTTYTDILEMFFDIMSIAKLNVYPTSKTEKDVNGDSVEMWGIMFSDPNLKTFLSDWQRMRGLYISGAIDQDLYLIWLEREVKKYNFSIIPELEIPMHSPLENADSIMQNDSE